MFNALIQLTRLASIYWFTQTTWTWFVRKLRSKKSESRVEEQCNNFHHKLWREKKAGPYFATEALLWTSAKQIQKVCNWFEFIQVQSLSYVLPTMQSHWLNYAPHVALELMGLNSTSDNTKLQENVKAAEQVSLLCTQNTWPHLGSAYPLLV